MSLHQSEIRRYVKEAIAIAASKTYDAGRTFGYFGYMGFPVPNRESYCIPEERANEFERGYQDGMAAAQDIIGLGFNKFSNQ